MINNIFKALGYYSQSLAIISKLKLWKYFFIPITISVLVGVLIFGLSYTFSNDLGHFIAAVWKWDWGKKTFEVISTFISGILIIAIGLVLYKHIVMAFSAPFMSPVSEKIEAYLTGTENHQYRKTTFTEQLVRGIRINIRNLGKELLYTIPIILFSFIPVIGIFSSILLFLMQAFYAGFGNMDYTLERHFNYKESINFVKQSKGLAIGNGIGFLLIVLIPVVGFILVLPLSVTAASIQTTQQIRTKLPVK
ncbi:EI24 domain-containing protein [Tenacibaculum geojense]|uniref:EI24 domain-containing protein n=1 Tax=Tenacibaculum geojense TaxID=915352 RepID=A0ABW3JU53_9FLAO